EDVAPRWNWALEGRAHSGPPGTDSGGGCQSSGWSTGTPARATGEPNSAPRTTAPLLGCASRFWSSTALLPRVTRRRSDEQANRVGAAWPGAGAGGWHPAADGLG